MHSIYGKPKLSHGVISLYSKWTSAVKKSIEQVSGRRFLLNSNIINPVLANSITARSVHQSASCGLRLTDITCASDLARSPSHRTINCPQFGVDYDLSEKDKRHIQTRECQLFVHNVEVRRHLAASRFEAAKQQATEPEKKIRQLTHSEQFRAGTDPGINRFDQLKVSEHTLNSLRIDTHHFSQTCAIAASSSGHRKVMEDTHYSNAVNVNLGNSPHTLVLNAVMDGHGGIHCAHHVQLRLPDILSHELSAIPHGPLTDIQVANALLATTVKLDQLYNSEFLSQDEYTHDAGCTLNLSLQIGDKIYFANVGDSRALFVTRTGTIWQLTPDHTLKNPALRREIIERNGFIITVAGVPRALARLMMPRAIGDHWANGAISARASITCYEKSALAGGVIVHACDGLFETASTNQFGRRLSRQLNQGLPLTEVAVDAVRAAYDSGSGDNLTVLMYPT